METFSYWDPSWGPAPSMDEKIECKHAKGTVLERFSLKQTTYGFQSDARVGLKEGDERARWWRLYGLNKIGDPCPFSDALPEIRARVNSRDNTVLVEISCPHCRLY